MGGASISPGNDVMIIDLPEFLVETDLESELSPEFAIKEEMIEEVMQELYKEITCSTTSTCTKTDVSPSSETPSPLSSLSISLSSPFFVSSSGKGESCGASVSDSASSVMAGVEYTGAGVFGNAAGDSSVENEGGEFLLGEGWMIMDGCDGVEFGDEWLEKVMGWAPLEVEGWS